MAKKSKEVETHELQHNTNRSGSSKIPGSNSTSDKASSNPQNKELFRAKHYGPRIISTASNRLLGLEGESVLHHAAGEEIKGDLINLRFYAESMVKTLSNIIETFDTVQKYDDERRNRKV